MILFMIIQGSELSETQNYAYWYARFFPLDAWFWLGGSLV